jgi:hypothetical protein
MSIAPDSPTRLEKAAVDNGFDLDLRMALAKVPVDEVVNYTVLMAIARELGKAA